MFGLSFNRRRETYIDYSKKPGTEKFIEFIESQLTSDQLKKLEIILLGKTFGFKTRMMVAYGHMHPISSLENCKEDIKEIIKRYSPLFDKGIEFDMNDLFIRRLGNLFILTSPLPNKFLIN